MKKNTKLAYAVLGIVFILFNVIAFSVPTDKTIAFWIAYAFTVVAFVLQIGIWNAAFKAAEVLKSKFLGIPIIYAGIAYLVFQLIVFAVFMMRQFILSVPRELDEAAMIDGCGYFRIYATIILPVLRAPIVSLAILSGLSTWKDMMWPLIVIRDRDKMPVVSGLSTLADYFANKYPQLMAGGVLCSIPVIIFFFVLQKYFVAGIASQGIKE